jgi:hypothetical protein
MLYNLTVDETGVIGQETWDRILELVSEIRADNNGGDSGTDDTFPLRAGQENEYVELMQRYLNAIRTLFPDIPQLEESGYFDLTTFNAVRTFQMLELDNLTPDGVVNREIWEAIERVYNGLQ